MSTNTVCSPLSLEHQPIVTQLWKKLCVQHNLQYSEYSFANDFIFRQKHNYCFVPSDPPFIRGEFKPNHYYYIPTVDPEQWKMDFFKISAEKSACFFPIAESWLYDIQKFHPSFTSCRSETDYLYTAQKLQTFSGRALSSRRNLLSQLLKNHTMEAKPLTQQEKSDALVVLEAWQDHSELPEDRSDYRPCLDALEYMDRLELFGRVAYAEGQPVGFTIGEMLTPTTALLHFSKALHIYKGITPFLYQDFARHLPDTVQWINLEQDLGLPSLRRAKEAYEPDLLLTKWHVTVGGPARKLPLVDPLC